MSCKHNWQIGYKMTYKGKTAVYWMCEKCGDWEARVDTVKREQTSRTQKSETDKRLLAG